MCIAPLSLSPRTIYPPWQFHFHLWFGGLNTSLIESSSPSIRRNDPEIPFSLVLCGLALKPHILSLKHINRIFGHCNKPALLVSHFQASK